MRIVRIVVDVAVLTSNGLDKVFTNEEIIRSVEMACQSADDCLAAEVIDVKSVEVANG